MFKHEQRSLLFKENVYNTINENEKEIFGDLMAFMTQMPVIFLNNVYIVQA